MPHPSEPIMNVRIQCHEDNSGNDTKKVLNKGLTRISKMCDVMEEKFNNSLKEFEKNNQK